jgi:hypothetical protein
VDSSSPSKCRRVLVLEVVPTEGLTEGLIEILGLTDVEGDTEGLLESEGLTLGLEDTDGLTLILGETEGDSLGEMLGLVEPVTSETSVGAGTAPKRMCQSLPGKTEPLL